MLNTAYVLYRSLFRRPMTAKLLRETISNMLDDPPTLPWFRDWLTCPDDKGRTLFVTWQNEIFNIFSQIENRRTWSAQRKFLLRRCIQEAGWIALFSIVKKDDDVRCWEGFVENVDSFIAIKKRFTDVNERRMYDYDVLSKFYIVSMMTYVVLQVLGAGAYGLSDRDMRGLNFYLTHRKYYVHNVVANRRGLFELRTQYDGDSDNQYFQAGRALEPAIEEVLNYNTSLADRVINQTIDFSTLTDEIAELEAKKESVLVEVARQIWTD